MAYWTKRMDDLLIFTSNRLAKRQRLNCDGRTLRALQNRGFVTSVRRCQDSSWSFILTKRGQRAANIEPSIRSAFSGRKL